MLKRRKQCLTPKMCVELWLSMPLWIRSRRYGEDMGARRFGSSLLRRFFLHSSACVHVKICICMCAPFLAMSHSAHSTLRDITVQQKIGQLDRSGRTGLPHHCRYLASSFLPFSGQRHRYFDKVLTQIKRVN